MTCEQRLVRLMASEARRARESPVFMDIDLHLHSSLFLDLCIGFISRFDDRLYVSETRPTIVCSYLVPQLLLLSLRP